MYASAELRPSGESCRNSAHSALMVSSIVSHSANIVLVSCTLFSPFG
nr:MAG TPA: hypothetical protein [Caudoviricetes sp.]